MAASRQMLFSLALLLFVASLSLSPVLAKRGALRYEEGDSVILYANKVGPFKNPSETYQYYKLPFCQPDELSRKRGGGLGEVVDGNRLVASPYSLRFAVDVPADRPARLCSAALSADDVDLLRGAVLEDYYFQFVVDELPVYGFLGKVDVAQDGEDADAEVDRALGGNGGGDKKTVRLFTHLHLDATFNGDRVISVTARTDPLKSVVLPAEALAPVRADFTYSVTWTPTDVALARRMDRYRRDTFLPQHLEVHWFAIANSCVTVLLLTAFLATILVRVLRADVSRYVSGVGGGGGGQRGSGRPLSSGSGGGGAGGVSGAINSSSSSKGGKNSQPLEDPLFLDLDDGCDETGWKYLAHDVFRPPKHRALFCALLGAGAQVAAMACGVFALAACGFFYPHARGAMQAALIGLYGATAGFAGYVSGSYHRQLGGGSSAAGGKGDWVRCQLLTATVLAGPVFLAFCVSNTVAWAWGSTAALPAGTVAVLICGWAVATLPLTLLGGVVGKNSARPFDAPTRTARFAREVPALPWWRGAWPQALAAGFLPFSAIYIELYYVFLSVWGHKTYTIYSILAIVFVILLLVTAFVTVALTYFQLAAEDHRWWWRSLACGASTGLFVAGYALYFYLAQSDMEGLMQGSFFFGYTGVCCWALSLMLGYVGWRASLAFVRGMYRAIKSE